MTNLQIELLSAVLLTIVAVGVSVYFALYHRIIQAIGALALHAEKIAKEQANTLEQDVAKEIRRVKQDAALAERNVKNHVTSGITEVTNYLVDHKNALEKSVLGIKEHAQAVLDHTAQRAVHSTPVREVCSVCHRIVVAFDKIEDRIVCHDCSSPKAV